MTVSKSILIPADGTIFFYGRVGFHCIYVPHHLYFSDKHLSCFHVLAIINSATVNSEVHASFQILVFGFSFVFLILSCMSCLYILEISSLSLASFTNIFYHPEGCLFILIIASFAVKTKRL